MQNCSTQAKEETQYEKSATSNNNQLETDEPEQVHNTWIFQFKT